MHGSAYVHTASYLIYAVMATTQVAYVAQSEPPMSIRSCVIMAALISFIGSAAATSRKQRDLTILVQAGLNSAVLGVSGILLSHAMIGQSYNAQMVMLGVCGILSLGGVAVVDWAVGLMKSVIERRVDEKPNDNTKQHD